MVVDLARGDLFATVDIGRFVGHLGTRGEPALAHGIDERTGRHEGRSSRPEAKADVFDKRPVIAIGVAIVGPGDGAIHLHAGDGNGKTIVAAGQSGARAIDLDFHAGVADRGATFVARFGGREELHGGARAVGEMYLLRRADVQVDDAE